MNYPVLAVCVSEKKGIAKEPVARARLMRGFGIEGDAHGGTWHRQVSLLARGAIEKLEAGREKLPPGAFGENLVIDAENLRSMALGRRLKLGRHGVIQITQRGKVCHDRCAIFERLGDCVMPREGLFARVLRSGELDPGDLLAEDPDLDRCRYAVITLSDRAAAGERDDLTGPLICETLDSRLGGLDIHSSTLPDDRRLISERLRKLADEEVIDLIITTGGTGLSPRDVTPEATLDVVDRRVPGMAEEIRRAGLAHTPRAMLSRGVCGMRGQTLVINLSGSPRAATEQLETIMPVLLHALEVASGLPQDCGHH